MMYEFLRQDAKLCWQQNCKANNFTSQDIFIAQKSKSKFSFLRQNNIEFCLNSYLTLYAVDNQLMNT